MDRSKINKNTNFVVTKVLRTDRERYGDETQEYCRVRTRAGARTEGGARTAGGNCIT